MDSVITTDDILGKEALDSEGEILGVIMKVHLEKDAKKIVGITIDQGFMKPDLYMGIEYVKNFGVDTVFLNRVPENKFRGLEVITHDGRIIGKVKSVQMDRSRILKVTCVSGTIKKHEEEIGVSAIKEIGARVVLKKGFGE